MRIIRATQADVPRIMDCAREFTSKLPDCELNENHYGSFWRSALSSNMGIIFLLENDTGEVAGGIGGIKHPDLLTAKLSAVELFWYVRPENRGWMWSIRLLDEFEGWAKRCGCSTVAMIHMESSMPKKLKKFYERRGYLLIESHYRKTL